MKFQINDGRPWYKQAVSGALLTFILLAAMVLALYVGVVLFVVLMVLWTFPVAAIKIVGGVIAGLAVMAGLFFTFLWARDEL